MLFFHICSLLMKKGAAAGRDFGEASNSNIMKLRELGWIPVKLGWILVKPGWISVKRPMILQNGLHIKSSDNVISILQNRWTLH